MRARTHLALFYQGGIMSSVAPRVVLYTDGSAKKLGPNGDVNGGWAYVLRWRDMETEDSGSEAYTTNNRMELKAIIEGIKQLVTGCCIDLYSDSQYALSMVINLKTKWYNQSSDQWQTKSGNKPQNMDLLEDLLICMKKYNHRIYTHWVKGHLSVFAGGHELNARCDKLAYAAMAELSKSQGRPLKPRFEKSNDRNYFNRNFHRHHKKKKHWNHDHTTRMTRFPEIENVDLW